MNGRTGVSRRFHFVEKEGFQAEKKEVGGFISGKKKRRKGGTGRTATC